FTQVLTAQHNRVRAVAYQAGLLADLMYHGLYALADPIECGQQGPELIMATHVELGIELALGQFLGQIHPLIQWLLDGAIQEEQGKGTGQEEQGQRRQGQAERTVTAAAS